MLPAPHPAAHELAELKKHVARADDVLAKANQWPKELSAARDQYAAAQIAFIDGLDPAAATDLAEASANLSKLSACVETVQQAGGAVVLRRKALETPAAFALLAVGLEKKHNALGKLKAANHAAFAKQLSVSVARGEVDPELIGDPFHLSAVPLLRQIRADSAAIEEAAQAAVVAFYYAEKSGNGYAYRSFDSLLELLASPLPVLTEANGKA